MNFKKFIKTSFVEAISLFKKIDISDFQVFLLKNPQNLLKNNNFQNLNFTYCITFGSHKYGQNGKKIF